jgi:hypothetical protein
VKEAGEKNILGKMNGLKGPYSYLLYLHILLCEVPNAVISQKIIAPFSTMKNREQS